VEELGDTTTVWLGTTTGIISYKLWGYFPAIHAQLTQQASHDSLSIYKIVKQDQYYYFANRSGIIPADSPMELDNLTGTIATATEPTLAPLTPGRLLPDPQNFTWTGGYFGGFLRSSDRGAFFTSI